MKYHPLSEYLPIMPGHELDELAGDIKENGLREPITIFEKKILDGRNRYLACKRAGVKSRFQDLDEDEDPLMYVISKNVARRHLSQSQKAMVIAKITSNTTGWKHTPGQPSKKRIGSQDPILSETTVSKAAEKAGVSASTAKRAKRVYSKSKDKARKVEEGKLTVTEAERELAAEQSTNGQRDALGYPIPEPAMPYWKRADEVKDILKQISKLKTLVEELHERNDPLYSEVNLSWARVELGNIYQAFKSAVPYVVCTSCQGQLPDTCTLCKGRGLLSQFRWERALPQEARDMRLIACRSVAENAE